MKTTIILCEDENLIALDIRNQLRMLGYDVIKVCSTGEDLIKSTMELKPHIIITDIQLKGKISGIEAVKIIRQEVPIPYIFLSGQRNTGTYDEAMKTNPAYFINKPFSLEQLQQALSNCCNIPVIN